MHRVSLCMRIANKRERQARDAVETGIKYTDPTEVLVSSPDDLPYKLQGVIPSSARVFPGVRDRTKMIECWFRLFDEAQGDWIVNLDDDDVALCSILPSGIPSDVAFFHGDVAAVFTKSGEGVHRDVLLRRSCQIETPEMANKAYGSYWAMRKSAWDRIAPYIERDQAGFNDFRIVWHLMKSGWRTVHVPSVTQIQRARPVGQDSFYHAVTESTGGWVGTCEHLEKTFGMRYGAEV